jgi:hypothetical protein
MHLADKSKHWLRVKGWKKIFQANGSRKQAGVVTFISNKVYFKSRLVKEGHFLLIKETIYIKRK